MEEEPANLPLLLLDETLMDQVLVNLLDNAAKYTPAGSTIEIGVVRHRFSIAIHVRDDGPGVPPGDLDRIFDKFYRVREDADRSRAGTGLGLAICRGFVIAMGGRIHARNRSETSDGGPAHGAEFLIEFSPELIADTAHLCWDALDHGRTVIFEGAQGTLLDIDYKRDIVFESFSTTVVDEGLSLACAIWRDTWTENDPLAAHAKAYIELKMAEAKRRRATNARP